MFKYQQRIKLFLCIHRHERSIMHFCDCCRLFVEFDVTIQQIYVVLKNNKKCELCTCHEQSCDVASAADCKKISVSQNFALLIIIKESRWLYYEAHKNSTLLRIIFRKVR